MSHQFLQKINSLRFAYILILAVLVSGVLGSFYFVQQSDRMSERVLMEDSQNLIQLKDVRILNGIVGINLRSYLLTGDGALLEDRKKNLDVLNATVLEVQSAELHPEIKRKFLQVEELRSELSVVSEIGIQMKRGGAKGFAIAKFLEEKIQPARVRLEGALEDLVAAQEVFFNRASELAVENASKTKIWILALSLCALLVSGAIGWAFSKRQIQLMQKLQLSEAELRRRNSELDASIRSRDDMVGVISHELKNPLTALQMGATLLQRSSADDPNLRRFKVHVDRLGPSINRMNQLISDLLDVTRLEAGALKLTPVSCDLGAIVQEVLRTHEAFAEQRLLQLRSEIGPEIQEVYCDPGRTTQILVNLLNNAIKFTNAGGEISIHSKKYESQVEIRVTDTGKGIAKESLPHIFDRFWQSKETAHQGTGLGLSIVKGLVEAQGGKIWAESQPGVGTSFYFTIPLRPAVSTPRSVSA